MRFALPFFAWFLLGFLGIVAMAMRIGVDDLRAVEGAPRIGDGALTLLLIVQPSIILAVAVALGVTLSEKVGLRSWLTDRVRGDPPALISFPTVVGTLALTVAAAILALLVDVGFRLTAPAAFAGMPGPDLAFDSRASPRCSTAASPEELMLRYGLMTGARLGRLRVLRARAPQPSAGDVVGRC